MLRELVQKSPRGVFVVMTLASTMVGTASAATMHYLYDEKHMNASTVALARGAKKETIAVQGCQSGEKNFPCNMMQAVQSFHATKESTDAVTPSSTKKINTFIPGRA